MIYYTVKAEGCDGTIQLAMGMSEANCRAAYDNFVVGNISEETKGLLSRDTNWLKLSKIETDANDKFISEEVVEQVDMQDKSWWNDLHNGVYNE